jgi:hypothetical protein
MTLIIVLLKLIRLKVKRETRDHCGLSCLGDNLFIRERRWTFYSFVIDLFHQLGRRSMSFNYLRSGPDYS